MQFFDKRFPMLTLKKELPKEIIFPTRKMINKVKELSGFFSRKM